MSIEIKNSGADQVVDFAVITQGGTGARNDAELVLTQHRPIIVGGGWRALLRTFAFSANGQLYS